jgi:hypothetical protein
LIGRHKVTVGLRSINKTAASPFFAKRERQEDRRTAEEQRQRAEEQLTLARQQADTRPAFEVTVDLKPYSKNVPELEVLEVEVLNSGKVAANSVYGWVYFEASKLVPYDPWAAARRSGKSLLPPHVLHKLRWGSNCDEGQESENGYFQEISYRVVSSEGAEIAGSTMIEISAGEGEVRPS